MWDMQASRFELSNSASCFEFSTINFGVALGLAASIDEILDHSIDKVWQHNCKLIDTIISGCDEMNLHIVSPLNNFERSAIISLEPPPTHNAAAIVERLQNEYGILVTNRSGLIRISPHIDNNQEETIIIGAHYDHLGYGDFGSLYAGERAIHNGADDNSSGVSILLNLAYSLLEKSIDFIILASLLII